MISTWMEFSLDDDITHVEWRMLEWVSLSCTPWCPWQQFNVMLGPAIARKAEAEHIESRRLLCEVTLAFRMSEH
eukprot:7529332-Heterocapsa_arctica.AAC.1